MSRLQLVVANWIYDANVLNARSIIAVPVWVVAIQFLVSVAVSLALGGFVVRRLWRRLA